MDEIISTKNVILIILIVLVALIFGVWAAYQDKKKKANVNPEEYKKIIYKQRKQTQKLIYFIIFPVALIGSFIFFYLIGFVIALIIILLLTIVMKIGDRKFE